MAAAVIAYEGPSNRAESAYVPADASPRHTVFELIEHTGCPDEHDKLGPLMDTGQASIRLWWD